MDKLCATCGKQLQPDQGFCENCGSAWTPVAETQPGQTTKPISAASSPVVQQPAVTARKSGAGKALLLVAIAAVAVGIGGWFFLRQRPAAASPVAATSSPAVIASTVPRPPSTPAAVNPSVTAAPASSAAADTPAAIAATTEAAANSRPCSLLTRDEMEKIVGEKIVKITTDSLTCSYFTDDTISADVDTTWSGGRAAIAEAKGFNSGPGQFEPVAGIGDEAYMQAAGVLHVLKGDTYLVVNTRQFPNDSGDGHLEMEGAIARTALAKLK